MARSFALTFLILITLLVPGVHAEHTFSPSVPLSDGISLHVEVNAAAAEEVSFERQQKPALLAIPSIALNAPIIEVGLTPNGAMDVPDGRTSSVGWYKYGTIPGNVGSAVFDAHVYAAFKNLYKVREGDYILSAMESGTVHRFRVTDVKVYPLEKVPRERLFNTHDDAYLNLITCAGSWSKKRGTYSHRLVVYATLQP